MSVRHEIYAAVTLMGAPKRMALVAHVTDAGHPRRTVQNMVTNMIRDGQLLCGPGRALNRTLRAGDAPLQPSAQAIAQRRAAGRPRTSEPAPALQPIWPAVAGAPIGGPCPCIA